jgi:DNA-binding NtrC family response regulator
LKQNRWFVPSHRFSFFATVSVVFLLPVTGAVMERVLIVDDEENTRIGLSKLLNRDGYQTKAAADGLEALEYLGQENIDLVITDISMPGMNGLDFLYEVRKLYPEIKVVMMTAYGGVDSYLNSMNLGAFDYLNKPVKLRDLKAILERIFVSESAVAQ